VLLQRWWNFWWVLSEGAIRFSRWLLLHKLLASSSAVYVVIKQRHLTSSSNTSLNMEQKKDGAADTLRFVPGRIFIS